MYWNDKMGIWQSLLLGGQIKMKNEESKEQYDISDYHRLECLGDDIKDILLVILKNIYLCLLNTQLKNLRMRKPL